MPSTIFSTQPGHVGPIAPDKMTTTILDNFVRDGAFPMGFCDLVWVAPQPFIIAHYIKSYIFDYISSCLVLSFDIISHDYVIIINHALYLHDYKVFTTCNHMTTTFFH